MYHCTMTSLILVLQKSNKMKIETKPFCIVQKEKLKEFMENERNFTKQLEQVTSKLRMQFAKLNEMQIRTTKLQEEYVEESTQKMKIVSTCK